MVFRFQCSQNRITDGDWLEDSIFNDGITDNAFFNQSGSNYSLRIIKNEVVVWWLKASDQEISLLINAVLHVVNPMPLLSTLK